MVKTRSAIYIAYIYPPRLYKLVMFVLIIDVLMLVRPEDLENGIFKKLRSHFTLLRTSPR